RGYTREIREVKPDLAAPGVQIMTAAPGGGYQPRTGTSFATPFVTGAAALLMQYGIIDGKDPYMYGEKVKAQLIYGARHLRAEREYPNRKLGWGALCLRDSIPE
ncbi:MAG: S8 family serine peptidase, partial [Lachnospiraceae bacterium]|nr:S8 family serine peptidase [Lachnospiraceae bacterium]